MTAISGIARVARRTQHHSANNWKRDGACTDDDFPLFFGPEGEREPERIIREEQAIEICGLCSVRARCLAYAMEHNEQAGVWGGMSEQERKVERRRLQRAVLRTDTKTPA